MEGNSQSDPGSGEEGDEEDNEKDRIVPETEISEDAFVFEDDEDSVDDNDIDGSQMENIGSVEEQSTIFHGYNPEYVEDIVEAIKAIEPVAAATIEETVYDKQRVEEEVVSLREKISELQQEHTDYKNRKEKQIEALKQTAAKDFIQGILPVRDDIHRVREQVDGDAVEDALSMILDSFDENLETEGVQIIQPEPGDDYNAQVHEVMKRVDTDDVGSGEIVEMHRPGYKIEDLVLQTARVTVNKRK